MKSECRPSAMLAAFIERPPPRSRVESWPNEFALNVLYTDSERDIRREMSHWVLQTGQPTVNFMPTRMRGSSQHDTNIALFRSLSKVLMENHTVRTSRLSFASLAGFLISSAYRSPLRRGEASSPTKALALLSIQRPIPART